MRVEKRQLPLAIGLAGLLLNWVHHRFRMHTLEKAQLLDFANHYARLLSAPVQSLTQQISPVMTGMASTVGTSLPKTYAWRPIVWGSPDPGG